MGCLQRGQCLKISVFFRVKKSSFTEGHILSAFLPTSYKLTQSPQTSPFICFPERVLSSYSIHLFFFLCNFCLSCLQALFLRACSSLKKKKKKFFFTFPLSLFVLQCESNPLIHYLYFFSPTHFSNYYTVWLLARYLPTELYLLDSPIIL